MRTMAALVGLVVCGALVAADDPPKDVTIRPNGRAEVVVGQNIRFTYPVNKEGSKFKRLTFGDKTAFRLKETTTGTETYVTYAPTKAGTFKPVVEVFIGTLENAQVEKHNYTVVVKKKDE